MDTPIDGRPAWVIGDHAGLAGQGIAEDVASAGQRPTELAPGATTSLMSGSVECSPPPNTWWASGIESLSALRVVFQGPTGVAVSASSWGESSGSHPQRTSTR